MALVHSRVRDVYILRGMPLTGGCGLPSASAHSSAPTPSSSTAQLPISMKLESSALSAATAGSASCTTTSSLAPVAPLLANPTRMVVAQPNINHRYRVWCWRISEGGEGQAVLKDLLGNGIGDEVDA